MSFAAVDLQAERWQQVMLIIATLQPLLVLLVIVGFVVASAHLLTMIGTRWGDRRVSSKALLFSLGMHLLFGCGLVAMIPEYRAKILTKLAELENEPIRILSPFEPQEVEASGEGRTPVWNEIARTETPDRDRFQAPALAGPVESALNKPNERTEFKPELVRDKTELFAEPLPVPEQELHAEQGRLREARVQMTLETIRTEARPEVDLSVSRRDRTARDALPREESGPARRPDTGGVDLLSPEASPDRSQSDLTERLSPQAPLGRAEEDDLAGRQGPAPAAPGVEPIGLAKRGGDEQRARNAAPMERSLARTQPRAPASDEESASPGRYRPNVEPARPETPPARPLASKSSRAQEHSRPGEQPELARQEDAFLDRSRPERVPKAYSLRSEQERERAVIQYGGSEESEAAVDRSLKWLASMQTREGCWDANATGAGRVGIDEEGIDRKFAGRHADTGVTALAVLAFLGKLHTVDQGEHSPVVERALRWLIAQQKPMRWPGGGGATDGYLGGNATEYAGMYCHGMATFALGEAYAMSKNNAQAQWLREPLRKGVHFILDTQLRDGGWRYLKGQPDGDMSMFGWQLMALKSAEAAGIEVPESARIRMQRFLESRRTGRQGGLAGYREKDPPTPAMTAEALFCRQILGISHDQAADREAVDYLLAHRPRRTTLNYYYWYYGTLAMYQRGGSDWEQWNEAMRDLVISEQRQSGPLAGSWDPRDVWGGYGGRVYSTAIATLSLEVYYRYLPLYRLHGEADAAGADP